MFKSFDLPLLKKELIEQSNRRRTYIIRTIYAFFFFGLIVASTGNTVFSLGNDPYAVLGYGRIVFNEIFFWQALGIYFFMPGLASTTITREREAGTLDILMTTKLGPATIIRDKVFSQVVPIWTLILIATPLATFAYSLGGLSEYRVWSTSLLLLAESFRIACFGVACSAVSQSNIKAISLSYMWSTIGAVTILLAQMGPLMFGITIVGIGFACMVSLTIGTGALVTMQQKAASEIRADMFYDRKGFKPQDALENLLKNFIVRARDLPRDHPIQWREKSLRCQTRGNFMMKATIWIFALIFTGILFASSSGRRLSGLTVPFVIIVSLAMHTAIIIKGTCLSGGCSSHRMLCRLVFGHHGWSS